MKKPAVSDFRDGMAGWPTACFCLLLLALAAAPAWPQELAQDELSTTAGRAFSFQTFHGTETVTQSVGDVVGIGEVLWRTLRVNGTRGTYFGKYEVIRSFDPSQTRLFGADIIVFDAGARVNTLDNVQRVVAGYIEAAFGIRPADAARLGTLVTRYNAAHRGDMAYLSQKYTPGVMSHVTAENAGIALSHTEWPGKTRLLIPLGHTANGQPSAAATPAQRGAPAASEQIGTAVTPGKAGGTAAGGAAGTGGPSETGTTGGKGAGARTGTAAGSPAATKGAASLRASSQPGNPMAKSGGAGPLGRFLTNGRWLILLLLAPVLILVFVVIRLLRAGLSPAWALAVLQSAREGHPLVEMIVTTQNRHIGMRNVHYLRPGSSATVGAGRSTFLIYFVPVPRRMATLTYDGKKYTFTPRTGGLFPSLEGPLPDCLGKPIPAKSTRGYQFTIVFQTFVSPLEEINRLMRSIWVRK